MVWFMHAGKNPRLGGTEYRLGLQSATLAGQRLCTAKEFASFDDFFTNSDHLEDTAYLFLGVWVSGASELEPQQPAAATTDFRSSPPAHVVIGRLRVCICPW